MEQYLVDITLILDSTIRLAVPLILACLAGLYSERAGIVDIGLEGKLLAGAFAAAAMSAVSGSAWLGLLAGIGAALMFSGIHGLASINLKGNQTISGVALNFLAAGLTTFLGQSWFKRGGYTPQLERRSALQSDHAALRRSESKDVPVIGQIYWELISGHNIITYFAFLAVPVTAWVLFRTRFGLRLRAVGENPKAIDTAGISVTLLRYQALIITAVLVGIGGAYLLDRPVRRLQQQHVGRARLHRARGPDLCQMAAGSGAARLPDVRLPRRGAVPHPGLRSSRSSAKCRCRPSRCCPTSSRSSCSPGSSAAPSRRRPRAFPTPRSGNRWPRKVAAGYSDRAIDI